MGLSYNYVLLVDGDSKKRLWDYLKEVGTLKNVLKSTCLVLPFELDEDITDYIKAVINKGQKFYQWKVMPLTEQNYPQYITGNKGKIGCLYVDSYKSKYNRGHFISFTAATTDMSKLLQASPSIRAWFAATSRRVGAVACFLDLEEQGYQFIYPEEGKLIAEDFFLKKEEGFSYQLLQEYVRVVYGEEYLE